MTVVTLSASYGAGGSRVGPALAERLQATFLDRAIPAAVAEELAIPLQHAIDRDEAVDGVLSRVLQRLAPLGAAYGGADLHPDAPPVGDAELGRATADVLKKAAAAGDVVVLGRAGAVVLKDHPGALHVRLDGPADRRARQAVEVEGVDAATARRRLKEADRARTAYVKALHRCDPADPRLYHLVLDSTAVPLDTCVELIATAALSLGR